MAPSGQGTLVDVCDGKAHPQHLCGPWLGYAPRGGLSCGLEGSHTAQAGHGAGGLKVLWLGRPQRPSRQKGKLKPREGKSLA